MKDKQIILQDSCAFFYKHGFNGSSVEDVANHADITKKTLYRYFDSKEQLIADSLDYRHDWFMQNLLETLDDSIGIDVADKYFMFLKNWLTSDEFYGCMFINACSEFSDKNHIFHAKALNHKQQIIAVLNQRILQGLQDIQKAKQLADLLFINGEGLIVAMQVGIITKQKIDDFIATMQAQFTNLR